MDNKDRDPYQQSSGGLRRTITYCSDKYDNTKNCPTDIELSFENFLTNNNLYRMVLLPNITLFQTLQ